MKTIEESMLNHLEDWTALYPHTLDSSDIFVNQKTKQKPEEIARLMCREFGTIVEFTKKLTQIDVSDKYPGIQNICRNLISD